MSSSRKSDHYIPTLDGWRAAAIGLVIGAHASDSVRDRFADLGIDFAFPHGLGTLGVQIFFALSGFLITTKILDAQESENGFSLRDFYFRRVFRILPASLTFLVIVGLLTIAGFLDVTPGRWLSTVFFLANYSTATASWYVGHFWSLAVEEHFYMLWPLAFVHLRTNQRRLWVVGMLAIAVALWRAVAFKFGITSSEPAIFWGRTDIVVDAILCGVAMSIAYRIQSFRNVLTRVLSRRGAPLLFVLAVACVEFAPPANWKLAFALLSVKFALLPLMILSTVVQPRSIVGRLLELRFLRWVGLISYSLYLYQQLFLVQDEFAEPSLHTVQTAPLNILLAVAAGFLSYRLIEAPMIKLGHRLIKRRPRPER